MSKIGRARMRLSSALNATRAADSALECAEPSLRPAKCALPIVRCANARWNCHSRIEIMRFPHQVAPWSCTGRNGPSKHLRSRAQHRNSSMSWAAPHSPRAPGDPPHRSERPQGQTLVLRTRCQKHGGKKFDMHKRIPMLSLLSRRRERLVASGIELPHKETQTDPQQRDIEGHDQEGDRRCRLIQVFPHSEK